MDFITFVIAFGAAYITVNYVFELFRKLETQSDVIDCRKTNTMHTWYYADDGRMKCSVCKKYALGD